MAQDKRPWRRLYRTKAWQSLRLAHFAQHPLCVMCLKEGRANDGSLTGSGARQTDERRRFMVCDHKIPHRGDHALFFDPGNLQ
ncbi:MAG: hypothetical protein IE919_19620, partial [Thioclava sp.]|nr:hypothetical protein [Thioclava sp.]